MKVAVVHDALPFPGGAEEVLSALGEILPEADLFTVLYARKNFDPPGPWPGRILTSWIDKIPMAGFQHYPLFPLYRRAMRGFRLNDYDLLISSHYAAAHHIRKNPDQLHIAYVYSLMRYAWADLYPHDPPSLLGRAGRALLPGFRRLDRTAAQEVDAFAAISRWTAERIKIAYGREAQIIHPPVDTEIFVPLDPRQDYFLAVSRLTARKRVSLLVEAFGKLMLPLLVVGDGPLRERLVASAPENVRFLGWQSRRRIAELMGRARAFVHAAAEDFGIAVVEAQAAGCPVIAYGVAGVLETVRPGETGVFFSLPTVDDLVQAVRTFLDQPGRFLPEASRINALPFGKARFQREIVELIERLIRLR